MQNYDFLIQAKQEQEERERIQEAREQEERERIQAERKEHAELIQEEHKRKAEIVQAKMRFSKELSTRREARERKAAKLIVFALRQLSKELESLEAEEREDRAKADAVDTICTMPITSYRKALESLAEDTREFNQMLISKAARVTNAELMRKLEEARRKQEQC